MSTQQLAMDSENDVIPTDQWYVAPQEVQDMANEASTEGIPAAIGKNDKLGWFILHSGQGPYIAWSQHEVKA